MPEPAGRAAVLAQYRPLRAAIRRVLAEAQEVCTRADLERAVRQVVPWAEGGVPDLPGVPEMLADIALFEPNQRGRRAYDRFLSGRAARLGAADQAVAGQMAGAWFSLFRLAGRDAVAGLWVEDLLGGRRLLLMDEAMEANAPKEGVYGMRLFNAGPFHAAFGIMIAPEEDMLAFCLAAAERRERLPVRHSLAARVYADHLLDHAPPDPEVRALLEAMLAGEAPAMGGGGRAARLPGAARRPNPRSRRKPSP